MEVHQGELLYQRVSKTIQNTGIQLAMIKGFAQEAASLGGDSYFNNLKSLHLDPEGEVISKSEGFPLAVRDIPIGDRPSFWVVVQGEGSLYILGIQRDSSGTSVLSFPVWDLLMVNNLQENLISVSVEPGGEPINQEVEVDSRHITFRGTPWGNQSNQVLSLTLDRHLFRWLVTTNAESLLFLVLFGGLFLFCIILALNRRIIEPVNFLSKKAQNVEDAVLDDQLKTLGNRRDEIGVLTGHFINLLDIFTSERVNLQERIQRLDARERKLLNHKNHLEHKIEDRMNELDRKDRIFLTAKMATILGLAKLAEYRDEDTGAHLERIREYSRLIAMALQKKPGFKDYITDSYINDLYHSSILHDIGKVGIPDAILLKPARLTPEEFEIIKQHVTLGGETLSMMDQKVQGQSFLTLAKEIAYFHHEKWNGKGYNKGISGKDIPLSARIVAIVDVYDALTSKRCYKDAISHEEVLHRIWEERGEHFDPDIVDTFMEEQGKINRIREAFTDEPDPFIPRN